MRLIDANAICIKPEYMEDICGVAMIRAEDVARILTEQPTIELSKENSICEEKYRKVLQERKEEYRPTENDSDWWYNRKTGIIDGLEIAFEAFMELNEE